jgi:exopolysaccharide biosynthesis polyprenyl glycosylphosphotransferase
VVVTSPSVSDAPRGTELIGVRPIKGVRHRARLAPRWATPVFLFLGDGLALVAALALVGVTGGVALAYPAVALFSLAAAGAHRNRMTLCALNTLPWLLTRLAVPLLVLGPVIAITGDGAPLLLVAVASVGLLVVTRFISHALVRAARRRTYLLDRAVILGAGEVGAELGRSFLEHPEYGIALVGFLDRVEGDLPCPVLGDVDELDRVLGEFGIRRVIFAFGPAHESELVGVLRTAISHDVDVHIVPRFFDCGVVPEGPDTDDVDGIPLYRVRRGALRAPAWFLKRALDVSVAATVLALASPVLVFAAIAVKLSSPGPILFRQKRIGQGGREILVAKFRTLEVNHQSDTQWSVDDDPRLTPAGRLLRRTSIDELPQLWSVLTGDMSLVGPRPERPFFVRRFSVDVDGYRDRLRLPVGLTGWAQVHGLRGDTSIEKRARYDNQYIEHWNLWRDIVILVRTLAEVVRAALRGSGQQRGELPGQDVDLSHRPLVRAHRSSNGVGHVVGAGVAEQRCFDYYERWETKQRSRGPAGADAGPLHRGATPRS